jgi:mRNA interferase MazF
MAIHKTRQSTQALRHPLRGDIYLVDFDPTVGSEINKTRPALVLQNNIANRNSPITIVAAITSQFDADPYPTEVIMESKETGLPLRSAVMLNQIRSIDRRRLVKQVGRTNNSIMRRVEQALRISLGMVEL